MKNIWKTVCKVTDAQVKEVWELQIRGLSYIDLSCSNYRTLSCRSSSYKGPNQRGSRYRGSICWVTEDWVLKFWVVKIRAIEVWVIINSKDGKKKGKSNWSN